MPISVRRGQPTDLPLPFLALCGQQEALGPDVAHGLGALPSGLAGADEHRTDTATTRSSGCEIQHLGRV